MHRRNTSNKGFTLVEILIVVIILGILAAIVIPQFTNASTDARKNSLTSQLQTIRSQLELYKLQHNDTLPDFAANGWTQMTSKTDVNGVVSATGEFGPYLQQTPVNALNSKSGVHLINGADPTLGADPAPTHGGAAATTGFILNLANGKVWASNQHAAVYFDESTGTIVPVP
jgi:general secretion pathway protein G